MKQYLGLRRMLCAVLGMIMVLMVQNTAQAAVSFGNKAGRITMVEYFDYNCPVCRGYFGVVSDLAHQNRDLRVIQKVVPALAPSSLFVDQAVLASYWQGKFALLQHAIVTVHNPETISASEVLRIAKAVGLNLQQLQQTMQSPAVNNQLKRNMEGFVALHQHQIPVLEIYPSGSPQDATVLVGAVPEFQVQQVINNVRREET